MSHHRVGAKGFWGFELWDFELLFRVSVSGVRVRIWGFGDFELGFRGFASGFRVGVKGLGFGV